MTTWHPDLSASDHSRSSLQPTRRNLNAFKHYSPLSPTPLKPLSLLDRTFSSSIHVEIEDAAIFLRHHLPAVLVALPH
jgi:hypothetical protein